MKHNSLTLPLLQLAAATFVGRTEAVPVGRETSTMVEREPESNVVNTYGYEAARAQSSGNVNTESLAPRAMVKSRRDGFGGACAGANCRCRDKHSTAICDSALTDNRLIKGVNGKNGRSQGGATSTAGG